MTFISNYINKNLDNKISIYLVLYSFPIIIELLNLFVLNIFGNEAGFSKNFSFATNSIFFNSYLINFYRRSLLGTILDLMHINITVTNIYIIKSIFSIIFTHQFYKIFVKKFRIPFIYSIILITPFLLNISYRLQNISDLLIIVCFLISVRTFFNKNYLLSILFILFGVLTHEAYLFIFLPVNFYMFYKTKFLFFFSIVVLISVSFILTSNYDSYTLYLLEQRVQSYGFSIEETGEMFFKSNIKENVLYTINEYLEIDKNSGLRNRIVFFIPILLLYTFFYLYFMKFTRIKKERNFYKILLLINLLFLIILSFMGHDISRWFSLFLLNSLVIKFLYNNDLSKIEMNNFVLFNVITIFLGPLGATSTFPYLISIIKKFLIIF